MTAGHDPSSGSPGDSSGSAGPAGDVLSAVLRTVSLHGACFFSVEASAPWWAEVPDAAAIAGCIVPGARQLVSYHVVTEGRCWAGLASGQALWAESGDVVLIPHGHCYALSTAPRRVGDQPLEVSRTFFQQLTAGCLPPTVRGGGPGPERLGLLCGFLGSATWPLTPVLGLLPPLVRIAAASGAPDTRLARLIDFARADVREHRAGNDLTLLRISELLFIEVIRRYVAMLPPGDSGWLAGIGDPVVGRVLALLHERPADAWSLDRLARAAAVSRTVLAERFTRLVGQPPMHYLTRWRMQLASQRLIEGAPVGEVAAAVGYGSDATFSRAFRAVLGSPPSVWRRGQRQR